MRRILGSLGLKTSPQNDATVVLQGLIRASELSEEERRNLPDAHALPSALAGAPTPSDIHERV